MRTVIRNPRYIWRDLVREQAEYTRTQKRQAWSLFKLQPWLFGDMHRENGEMRWVILTDDCGEPAAFCVDKLTRITVDEDDDVVIDFGDDSPIPMGKYPHITPLDVLRSIRAELVHNMIEL